MWIWVIHRWTEKKETQPKKAEKHQQHQITTLIMKNNICVITRIKHNCYLNIVSYQR